MYALRLSRPKRARALLCCLTAVGTLASSARGQAQEFQQPESMVRSITRSNERLEMTVNTSQIIRLGTRIPRMVVNNPELVTATPLSETEIQVAARKPGVTQINLWDEQGQIYTVDLLIFGDVRELEVNLKRMFPSSSVRVVRLTNSLVLEGQVDRPEVVSTMFRLAEDYAPKVVDNLTVGGAQQVMLKVKVMEVSRTKLRRMATDFAVFGSDGFFASSVSDLIQSVSSSTGSVTAQGTTVDFGVVNGNTTFFGFLDWLEQNNVSKVLADPTLTAYSGRPASFNVGGELPILVPSGLGQTTIEYKKFGTQIDFVPIVLGNSRIRLEVRPRVSEIDDTRSVTVNSFVVPALKVREVDTGVEMNAGQTLALAGLVQERVDAVKRGLPYVMDIPVLGVPFRKVEEEVNEIELLILVTPDFAEAMDPHEVPPCGPGMETMSPSHSELYCKALLEVPACGPCGASDPCACTAPGLGCQVVNGYGPCGGSGVGEPVMATDSAMPIAPLQQQPTMAEPYEGENYAPPTAPSGPQLTPAPTGRAMPDPSARAPRPHWQGAQAGPANQPVPYNPPVAPVASQATTATPGLIGPIGYDVQK